MRYILLSITFLILISCGSGPKKSFTEIPVPIKPDYNNPDNWAALPTRNDNANRTPPGFEDKQAEAPVDVFFLHPTSYFGKKGDAWNANIDNLEINKSTDEGAILYQATAFNNIGKIYAPRYRQAVYDAYFTKDQASAKRAFDLAYQDVQDAFAYFLANYNNGRPFIIASHSQGTTHAARLIKEFIDGKPLENKMVAAYLIGIPVDLDKFQSLRPCESPDDTSCLIGWRTFKMGTKPKILRKEKKYNLLITNPLTWKTSEELVPATKNDGTLFLDFEAKPVAGSHSAQIHESILWTNKPKFKGSWLLRTKNYHRGDINLFYVNIRENAANRVSVFLNNK